MQNDDILAHDPGHTYNYDAISLTLETAIGKVRICPNSTDGKVRVSNSSSDRTLYMSTEPSGATDLIVRNLPYRVDFWAETFPQDNGYRVEIPNDIYARRADGFGLDRATEAATKKLRSEIGLALAAFLDTAEGAAFLTVGKVHAARNAVAYKADKVREAREALAAAEAEMAESVAAMLEIETAANRR